MNNITKKYKIFNMNLYECKEASQPYWVHWYQAGW